MNSSPCARAPRYFQLCAAAVALLGVVAVPAVSFAQQSGRSVIVLGLRAPDGDDDAATQVTAALRRAVRAAGYTTADDSPGLEQQVSAFGCDDSVPVDCLAQIANDLHAERMVWGSVRRQGRGRAAQLQIDVNLYENASHANARHETATVARATAQDSDAMRETATRMVRALLPSGDSSSAGSGSGTGAGAGSGSGSGSGAGSGSGSSTTTPPPPGTPAPIRRYLGIGLVAAGGVGIVVGVIMGVQWFALDGRCNGDDLTQCGGWRHVPAATTQDVCTMARSGMMAPMNVTWEGVRSTCDSQFTLSTSAYVLGGIGAGLIGAGLVLALTDHTGEAAPTSSTTTTARRPMRPIFRASPVIAPGFSGGSFEMRF